MKKILGILVVVIFMTGTFLQGCKDAIQKDAEKLGTLQKQKNEKVREILKCSNIQTRMILQNEFQILESKYNILKQDCERKYADSLDKRIFEETFKMAMRNE